MVVLLLFVPSPPVSGALVAVVDDSGSARGHGALHIGEANTHTILIADGSAAASCADSDGDGQSELTRASFGLRDIRTGESSIGVVLPTDDDVDRHGRIKVRFLWDRQGQPALEFETWIKIRFFG